MEQYSSVSDKLNLTWAYNCTSDCALGSEFIFLRGPSISMSWLVPPQPKECMTRNARLQRRLTPCADPENSSDLHIFLFCNCWECVIKYELWAMRHRYKHWKAQSTFDVLVTKHFIFGIRTWLSWLLFSLLFVSGINFVSLLFTNCTAFIANAFACQWCVRPLIYTSTKPPPNYSCSQLSNVLNADHLATFEVQHAPQLLLLWWTFVTYLVI